MKLFVKNTLSGLVPLYGADHDEKKRLKLGETYEVIIRQPRNVGFHRKFFALLNVGWENTEMKLPFEAYRRWAIMKAGFVDAYHTKKGVLFEPQSISFAKMDQQTFEDVYSRVFDIILEDLGVMDEELENQVLNFL